MDWHKVFEYKEGILFWKIKPSYAVQIGDEAGTVETKGYITVRLRGIDTKAHRIVWEMFNGKLRKEDQIDHINGEKSDNRIENLRLASPRENSMNKSRHRQGDLVGVTFVKNKFRAGLVINKKFVYLGFFKTEKEANKAYIKACNCIHLFENTTQFRQLITGLSKRKPRGYCYDKSKGNWMVYYKNKYVCRCSTEDEAKEKINSLNANEERKIL